VAERISAADSQECQKILAKEFVEAKKGKLNWYATLYLTLQNNLVEKILFKNSDELLDPILKKHA